MSFEIKPGDSRTIQVATNPLDIRNNLQMVLDRLGTYASEVIILNKTKTCKVAIHHANRNLIVEVTNEEKDSEFRFAPETNQTPEEPESDSQGTE